ncbi:T-box protein 2-like [Sitophilus oryzae]|uniref:T-box protein 2-like n=1 Tax=Sitophilus oryzae TaxID=7048 RepID=A0A6J2YVR9_SITOR|nr:T-box protein 2-like [Sitophilus oryzae]
MNRFVYGDGVESRVPYTGYNDHYVMNECQVRLKNDDLWHKFNNLENEMIITKTGRRMFPSLQIEISNLEPQSTYCVMIEMVPASHCRLKYSTNEGWAPAGSEEAQSPKRLYVHPESPAKGEYWMSQTVNFARMKLTNTAAPPPGQVVLTSMHKYQPRIIIAKTSDPSTFAWVPNKCIVFPETLFVAVTAYQNEKITQLKIDNNPFAKGFRVTGQSKCKRKKEDCSDSDSDELPCKTLKIDVESVSSSSPVCTSSTTDSPPSPTESEELKSPKIPSTSPKEPTYCYPYAWDGYYSPPSSLYHPMTYYPGFYPNYYGGFFWRDTLYTRQSDSIREKESVKENTAKKYSDFSIRSILGC